MVTGYFSHADPAPVVRGYGEPIVAYFAPHHGEWHTSVTPQPFLHSSAHSPNTSYDHPLRRLIMPTWFLGTCCTIPLIMNTIIQFISQLFRRLLCAQHGIGVHDIEFRPRTESMTPVNDAPHPRLVAPSGPSYELVAKHIGKQLPIGQHFYCGVLLFGSIRYPGMLCFGPPYVVPTQF